MFLDLGNKRHSRVAEKRAEVLDVRCRTDERHRDHVDTHLEPPGEHFTVAWCDGFYTECRAGDVDSFVARESAADFDPGHHRIAIDPGDEELDMPVVDKKAIGSREVMCESRVRDARVRCVTHTLARGQSECGAFFEDSILGHLSDAQFGPREIEHHGHVAPEPFAGRTHRGEPLGEFREVRVRRVETGDIHAPRNERVQRVCGLARWPDGRDDLRASHGSIPSKRRYTPRGTRRTTAHPLLQERLATGRRVCGRRHDEP